MALPRGVASSAKIEMISLYWNAMVVASLNF